jgi:hypothetical protein
MAACGPASVERGVASVPLCVSHHSTSNLGSLRILAAWPVAAQARTAGGDSLPLHLAADPADPSVDVARFLLERRPTSAREADTRGYLPLHVAVDREDPSVELVEHLVGNYPPALRALDLQRSTPLHLAVAQTEPSSATVRLLVEQSPDSLRILGAIGSLPVHATVAVPGGVCRPSLLEVVRLLVEPWPESVQVTDARGVSLALLAAAGDAPIGVVYFLVSRWPEDVSRAARRQSCLEMLGFLASESVHYSTTTCIDFSLWRGLPSSPPARQLRTQLDLPCRLGEMYSGICLSAAAIQKL